MGISASIAGADSAVVSREWLETNIHRGALGALYPKYIMEGDTPSFLHLIPTGLGSPEHPDWGSWGGDTVQSVRVSDSGPTPWIA
jgi:hypothetical protein